MLENVNVCAVAVDAGQCVALPLFECGVEVIVECAVATVLAYATEDMCGLFLFLFGFVLYVRLDNLRAAFVAVQAVIACELIRVVLDHLILGRQASSIAALDTKDSTICDVAYWGQLRK
jgi:hypothetical protein